MRSRLMPVAGAVLLAILPLTPIRAQDTDAMTKDSGTMSKDGGKMSKMTKDGDAMAMEPAGPGMLHGTAGHTATGTVHVLDQGGKHLIHFTSDFKTEPGSDVYVVLSTETKPVLGSVRLAKLKRFAGEQTVDVPRDVDFRHYPHLLLWSKKRDLVLATADLSMAGMSRSDKMSDKMGGKMGGDSSMPRSH